MRPERENEEMKIAFMYKGLIANREMKPGAMLSSLLWPLRNKSSSWHLPTHYN